MSSIVPGAPGQTLGGPKIAITAAAMVAGFMALLDISIVNISLPNIQAHFGAETDELGWVSTAYMMANVVAMPATGFFQRRFGYRRFFFFASLWFVIASALCAVAPSFTLFIAFRALQGLGGGVLIPLSQSILLARYPRHQLGLAGALFGVGAMMGPLLGPSIGARVLDIFPWSYLFWINVPIGLFAANVIYGNLQERARSEAKAQFDALGMSLLSVGLGSLQFLLEEGERRDWLDSRVIVVATLLSIGGLCAFTIRALRVADPLVDVRLFRVPSFLAATLLNAIFGASMISGSFLNALYYASVHGQPPVAIGDILLIANWIDFLIIPASSLLLRFMSARALMALGFGILAASFVMSAELGAYADTYALVLPAFVRSIGSSLIYVPMTLTAFVSLSERQRASAVGLFNVTRELGASVGTALVLSTFSRHRADRLALGLELGDAERSIRELGWVQSLEGLSRYVSAGVFAEAFMGFAVAIGLFMPLLLLLKRQDQPSSHKSPSPAAASSR